MKKLELKDVIFTEEEFENLSTMDKRIYIIQTEQEDTMWYQRTIGKIQLVCLFIVMVFSGIYLFAR